MGTEKVKRLTLFVSVAYNTVIYEVLCENDKFTGSSPSPVDFISDMQPLVDIHGLDFDSCEIVLQTDAISVSREYLHHIMAGPIQSYDRICILHVSYKDLMEQAMISLPVPQHCMTFFHLYLNAIRYIQTISETSPFSP